MMWKEKYKIGILTIDAQHEELFRRVSDFVQSLQQDGLWEDKLAKVQETMDFLKAYVVEHFDYEEQYQQEIGYPDRAAHHKIHETFKAEVSQYADTFAAEGYREELVQKLGGKLMAWLINHVVADDLKMARFVQAREVK